MADENGAFFLDTSTQISQTWEDEKVRSYLINELSQKTRYSSVYVKNEYKLNVLNDTILVYNAIVNSATLDEAESRLDILMKGIGRKPDDLPYKVFRRFFKQYKSKKMFLRKLSKIIEVEWQNYFSGQIKKKLFNLVECNSTQDSPVKRGDYYITITSRCVTCQIEGFLKSQQSFLKVLANIHSSKLDKTNDPKGTLGKIKNASTEILNGLSPHGKPCKEMSDAIISIEANVSDPTIILHSMDSDFKLLGEVLNIPTCVRSRHEILNNKPTQQQSRRDTKSS